MANKKKWIQSAVKRPGAFTQWCKRQGYSGVTDSCIARAKKIAKKRKDRKLMARATLAQRFRKGDLAR